MVQTPLIFLEMCVYWGGEGGSPHIQQAVLLTPAGCPTTLFNSDTVYLEMASDSAGSGPSPTNLPLPSSDAIMSPGYRLHF